jgi:diaminopimelate epimerase
VIIPKSTISEKMACNIAQNINYSQLYSDEANVEVVYRVDNQRQKAKTVVHERGVGFTLGCGTGAAAIYSVLTKFTGEEKVWNIAFPGGIVELSGDIQTSIELKGRVVFLYYGELHE